MRTPLLFLAGLCGLLVALPACGPSVEIVPHGVFPCEVSTDCDDSNSCTVDTCEAGRCRFRWYEADEGGACTMSSGTSGTCSEGQCR